MKNRVAALLVCGCAWVGGCASERPPTVEVSAARVRERTPEGAVIEFVLDAKNPNDTPLPMREVRYTVELDGRAVFSGVRMAERTLRRGGEQRVVLPAAVPAADLSGWTGGGAWRITGSLTYVTPGALAELLFDTGVRRPRVGFGGAPAVATDEPAPVSPPAQTP